MEREVSFDFDSWNRFCQSLMDSAKEIVENAPPSALDCAEGLRYLARLTQFALVRYVERPSIDAPALEYGSARIGAANPDYIYGSAPLSGSNQYLIRGKRNDAFNIGFGTYYGSLGTGTGLQCSGYLLLSDLSVDAAGNFEIIVSREKQPGNWLPMREETNSLQVRETLLNRKQDKPADIQIEIIHRGLDHCPRPLDEAEITRSLQAAGQFVSGVTKQFIGWTRYFSERPNEIYLVPPELSAFAKGDPNTLTYYGYFSLQEGQGLLVEFTPPKCNYWNFQIANHWVESLDYLDYQTHFNQSTIQLDSNGVARIVISKAKPTGSANWIDSAGHDRGCIAARFVQAPCDVVFRTEVVTV